MANSQQPIGKRLLSRKDVAELLEVSPEQVRKNERRWGLHAARRDLNQRCVRYKTLMALAILEPWLGKEKTYERK